jgi:hypothetical protein
MDKSLSQLIKSVHDGCHQLVHTALGRHLPVAGNVAIFCQTEEEFERLSELCSKITAPSTNPNQKYFQLVEPFVVAGDSSAPPATYTYLYIRKPSPDSPELGDIDFILPEQEYRELKKALEDGVRYEGAHVYEREGWDMIEIRTSGMRAVAYISTLPMAQKVRVRF